MAINRNPAPTNFISSIKVSIRIPLRAILIVPFVVQIFAAVGLTGWLSLRNGQQAVNEVTTQLRNEITTRIQEKLKNYLEVPPIIAQINQDHINLGNFNIQDTASVAREFWRQKSLFDSVNISGIYFGDTEGEFVGLFRTGNQWRIDTAGKSTKGKLQNYGIDSQGNPIELLEIRNAYDPRIRPWYKTAIEAKKQTWSDIYLGFRRDKIRVALVQPVYQDNNQLIGVVAVDFILSHIREFLQSLKIGKSGQTFIMERSGLLVASSTSQKPFSSKADKITRIKAENVDNYLISNTAKYLREYFGDFSKINQSEQLEFKLNGERQFLQVLPFSNGNNLDWLIVVVVPEADFMEKINVNTRTTIKLCLIALLVATIVGILTSRWISYPVMLLSAASREIAGGKLNQKIEVTRVNELEILAESFNLMAQQLQESFIELEKTNTELEKRVEERTAELQESQEKSERLLMNILPESIAFKLKHDTSAIADYFQESTILFSDIVGFTPLSARISPIELVNLLNQIFSKFDHIAEFYGLEKIKTIGDAYMVASGLPVPKKNHAEAIANMALDMQQEIIKFTTDIGQQFEIRIGINSGPVVAGVIGKKKFIYDLWGDAVNVASRMESSGEAGKIQVTTATYELLKDKYIFEERGIITVKGRGKMVTYWLQGKK
ncbi:adenylate/guanylate cyclase domain-containing protein [Dapis sp. BLCC M172]|uniref:adenylate/guanylate cyclase domain-containing protein n=1 Tax=Dapis sp. BLCC M172 TaxID=2975281 RepID=UPI003CE8842D